MTHKTSLSGLRITVLYNKPTARFAKDATHVVAEEDTEESAREIAEALTAHGMVPTLAPITEHDSREVIGNLPDDLVFNLIEWTGIDTPYAIKAYEYMHAKGLFYTGAALDTYLLSCDKSVMKARLESAGLPTARWQLFKTGEETVRNDFHYPLIVKVSSEHSSVGLTKEAIVNNAEEAKRIVKKRLAEYRQPVYIEEFLTGREFQVTLLERENGLAVLPISEVQYTKMTDVPFLTYNSRWDATHRDYDNSRVLLAKLTPAMEKEMHDMSVAAFRTFGYRDYARFDVRCQGDKPLFLEINSNPGLSDDEEYGMTVSYKAVGMTFADVVSEIVRSALRRQKKLGTTG
jgi:D-alanine-D-alanine ligase